MKKLIYFLVFSCFINQSFFLQANDVGKFFDSGYSNFVQLEYEKALKNFTLILETENKSDNPRKEKIAMIHKYRGQCFKQLKLYSHSINEYQKALDIYYEQNNQAQISNCLLKLGSLFSMIGKPEQGLIFFEDAVRIFKDLQWLSKLQESYFQFGKDYFKKEEYNQAKKYLKKSLSVNEEYGYSSDFTYLMPQINYYLSRIEYQHNNYSESMKLLCKAEDYCIQNMTQIVGLVDILIDIKKLKAELFLTNKDWNSFMVQIEGALKLIKKHNKNWEKQQVELLLIKYYDAFGKFEKSNILLQNFFADFVIKANPFLLETAPFYLDYIEQACCHFQLLYEHTNEVKYLVEKYEFVVSKLEIIGNYKNKTPFLTDLNYWNKQFKPLFDIAVETAIDINTLTNYSDYISNAIFVTEQFWIGGLNKNDEWILFNDITGIEENQIKLAAIADKVNSLLAEWKKNKSNSSKMFTKERDLIRLLNNYEKTYNILRKDLYLPQESKNIKNQTITELQLCLSSDELFIKFYNIREKLFQFIVSSDSISVRRIKLDNKFESNLQGYFQSVNKANPEKLTIDDIKFYRLSASFLYNKLFKPFEEKIKNKTLIIENSNVFKNISFDALLKYNPKQNGMNMKSYPFLVKYNNLRYAGSIPLYLKNNKKYHKSKIKYIGFAPFSKPMKNNSNGWLQYSGREIIDAAKLFNGKALLGREATKNRLLEYGRESEILHIATHAATHSVHPQLSHLVLSVNQNKINNKLYYYEVIKQKWDCRLIILGACGSSEGEYIESYGSASLSNAFQKSGAQGVIGANWEVSDFVSGKIILELLHQIKEGEEAGLALQKSKLKFINSASEAFLHPHYWAVYSFQGVSKTNSSNDNKNEIRYLLGALVLFSVLIYFLQKFFRRDKIF